MITRPLSDIKICERTHKKSRDQINIFLRRVLINQVAHFTPPRQKHCRLTGAFSNTQTEYQAYYFYSDIALHIPLLASLLTPSHTMLFFQKTLIVFAKKY